MKTRSGTKIDLESLVFLPSYAQYLLQHRLDEYARRHLELVFEMDIPLLKFVKGLSPEQQLALGKETAADFLQYLADNKAKEQISTSINRWMTNQLPLVKKHEINAEDITGLSHVRKQLFLQFLPEYARDSEEMIEVIRELDHFLAVSQTTALNAFINVLKDDIYEDELLIAKVNHTLPGAMYIFDIENFKGISSNNKLAEIIGYEHIELNKLGADALSVLIHPEDSENFKAHIEALKKARDGEVKVIKYRVKDKNGVYKWLANHESVLKRDNEGKPIQTIGITLDIDTEQKALKELEHKDRLHRQAEAVTHLGNYIYRPQSESLEWSEELYRIYGLDPSYAPLTYPFIETYTFPADMSVVREAMRISFETKTPFDFHYRILVNGKEKILQARGNYYFDELTQSDVVMGTVQDVTEKQTLIRKLRRTESVYKQAEELANMGNWSWEPDSGKIEWTEQLYRIYGLDPSSDSITLEKFIALVHPEDRSMVEKGNAEIFEKDRLDLTFRIITPQNQQKILRSVAQVQKDGEGKPVLIIGTERDITEKQTLINKLRQSESLYKQAQGLARVGNWSWDMETNLVEWSDELFAIFGIQPQFKTLTYSEYLSFVHPDDLGKVSSQIEKALHDHKSWEFTHRLVRKDGSLGWVAATGEVLLNSLGEPFRMFGTVQDITERQQLIERLQESEQLYMQAQSIAQMGNWRLDIPTGKLKWSDEMYRIFELPERQEMTFEQWLNFLPEDERKEVDEYYQECLRTRQPYDRIQKVLLRNGKTKTIHRKGEFVLDSLGNPVSMIGTTQDITEEHRVRQALEENQKFIRKITDAAPSIIASYDVRTGEYAFVSEGIKKILGYDSSELMSGGVAFFREHIHPDDLPLVLDKQAKALEEANQFPNRNDFIFEYTYRLRHANGHYRWIHTYGTIFDRDEHEKVTDLMNISIDITEQVEATEKIRDQEHFIQQLADASPTILYLYNADTQSIEYINREIFFVLGYMPEEVLEAGNRISQILYHPDDYHLLPARAHSGKNFQQVDSMIQYECRMKHKDGEWRWLLVREIVFKTGENGEVKQILGAALDINRRKEMEKTILQNAMLLEQSNASLEEFAYVASHDLKEPLRKISTFGDRLVATQMDKLTPEGAIYLNKIVDASQRMQTMINDLLAISMISGNRAYEKVSLQSILEDTKQTLEFKIEQLNAVIESDSLPVANIVPSQFRQLFQNLLSNSLKFVRPDVQPRISITHQFLPAAEVAHYHLAPASRYLCIEFSDNGIGFENEFSGKIFAIFQRLHGRSEYEGSGIGLAICKKIVEHHGGVIFAKGAANQGATFTIILPET